MKIESKKFHKLRAFLKRRRGESILSYSLILALIALICLFAVSVLGSKITTIFGNADIAAGSSQLSPSDGAPPVIDPNDMAKITVVLFRED